MPRMPHSTDDLEAAELELQRAVLAADVGALDALLDDEVTFVGPDGAALSKEQDLEAYRSGRLKVTEFAVERQRVRVLGELGLADLVATVAGTSEGAPFRMRLRYQRTWRLKEEWAVVSAHATVPKRGT